MSTQIAGEVTPLLNSRSDSRPRHRSAVSLINDYNNSYSEPSTKRRWPFHPSSLVILISALGICDGIIQNVGFFLQYNGLLRWSSANLNVAALLVANFPMVLAAPAGALTDWKCSRYVMLYWGMALQVIGTGCLVATAGVEHFENDKNGDPEDISPGMEKTMLRYLCLIGLGIAGLGSAGFQATTIALGVEQFWKRGESTVAARHFFPVYYLWINVAGGITMVGLSILQMNYGFLFGLIPVMAMYLVALILLHVYQDELYYTSHLADDGGLVKVWNVHRNAFQVWRAKRQRASGGARLRHEEEEKEKVLQRSGWLSHADMTFGGKHSVNDVADVRNFHNLLLVLIPTLFYSVIMSQTMTSFSSQGNRMKQLLDYDSDGDSNSSQMFIPAGTVSAVNCLAIIVSIPILYCCVYPRLERSSKWHITLFRRMGLGMIVALLSVGCATVVEIERSTPERWNLTRTVGPNYTFIDYTASSLSVVWQVPQYALSGVAEVLVHVSVFEFAYAKSPDTMKGLCTGLVYTISGLSGLMSAAIMTLLNSSVYFYQERPAEPPKVDIFYIVLMGVISVGIILFAIVTRKYRFMSRTSASV